MNRLTRPFVWLPTATLALMLVLPSIGQAQGSWSFQGRAGIAIPAGNLSDSQDPGPSFGAGLAYWIRDRLALRGDIDVDLLSGADTEFGELADITLYHFNGGIEYDLVPPSQSPWKLHANAGLGFTTTDVDVEGSESETDFTLNAGAKLGYAISPMARIFAGVQAYVILADETVYSFPIHGGFRILLPSR